MTRLSRADAAQLIFDAGLLPAGEQTSISYVMEVAAGAKNGDAVNAVFVADASGIPLSNTAESSVFVREDLLRSSLTIVGRVAANACNLEEDWPREITKGEGCIQCSSLHGNRRLCYDR